MLAGPLDPSTRGTVAEYGGTGAVIVLLTDCSFGRVLLWLRRSFMPAALRVLAAVIVADIDAERGLATAREIDKWVAEGSSSRPTSPA